MLADQVLLYNERFYQHFPERLGLVDFVRYQPLFGYLCFIILESVGKDWSGPCLSLKGEPFLVCGVLAFCRGCNWNILGPADRAYVFLD